MPSIKEVPVFCSYFHKYNHDYVKITQAYRGAILAIQNSFFSEDNPSLTEDEIKKKANRLIDMSAVFFTIIDYTTSNNPLLEYEISYAAGNNKTIIGLILPGVTRPDIPPIFNELRFNKYEFVSIIKQSKESLEKALMGQRVWEINIPG
jgi:hypothetical protein